MQRVLRLAGTAAMVLLIAYISSGCIPGITLSILALNAICGAGLKHTEVHNGKIHSQK